jgi:predicted transcriptional regulator
MLNKKLNPKLLWMQFEDVLAPRLGLTVKERAVYCYLLRHSLVVGKLRLQFAVMSLARTLGLSIGSARQAVRRLDELGALRVLERGKTATSRRCGCPRRSARSAKAKMARY